jgi:hypothetical protein
MSTSMFSVGLDVHKDSVTIAVFRNRDAEPMRVDRPPGRVGMSQSARRPPGLWQRRGHCAISIRVGRLLLAVYEYRTLLCRECHQEVHWRSGTN